MIHKPVKPLKKPRIQQLPVTSLVAICAVFSSSALAEQSGWHCLPNANNEAGWQCKAGSSHNRANHAAPNLKNSPAKNSTKSQATPEKAVPLSPHSSANKPQIRTNNCANNAAGNPSNNEEPLAFNFATQSKLPISTSAKQVDAEAGMVVFNQDVEFKQGDVSLRADHATLNTQSNVITLQGNIFVTTPAGSLAGDSATINMTDNQSEFLNAQYTLGEKPARGEAAVIRTNEKQQLEINRGSYTQCAGEKPVWRVKAAKITIDDASNQGSAKHARLEIYNTPVLYAPYARFPVGDARQSGVLFPALANTGEGADITLPYYFNIAENFDATLSPRYKNEHGYLTEIEARWLNRFDYWELSGAYIDSDDSIALSAPNQDAKRWLLSAKESGQFGQHIISSVDYTKISDIDYLRDLNTTSLSVSRATHLRQKATLGYYGNAWSSGVSVQQFQTIDPNINDNDKPLETLPSLWLRYQSLEKPFQINTQAHARYDAFSHDMREDINRSYGHLQFNFPAVWQGIKVTPAIAAEHLDYAFKDDQLSTTSPNSLSFTASEASLALTTNFEKSSGSKRKTLEPSLLYRYRKLTNSANDAAQAPLLDTDWLDVNTHTLWRSSRYSGYDILEETDQLSAAITHRQFKQDGTELIAVTLGQVLYFGDIADQDQPLQQSTMTRNSRASNLIGAFDASFSKHWQAKGSALWNSEQNHMREGHIAFRYHNTTNDGRQRIANLGYRFRGKNLQRSVLKESVEQADFSFVSTVGRHYGLIGRIQYDMRANNAIESLAGLEFDSCCVKLRLVYREGLVYNVDDPADEERDRSVFLQVELKGLMGIGDSLENLLKESIFGFGEYHLDH